MQDGHSPADEGPARAAPGARAALALLLTINLFNYIDRQVLSAVLPRLQLDGTIIRPGDPNAQFKLGLLTSAFMATYMLLSPVFGWLDGRGYRRWVILGIGVTGWSLASGSSGLATSYWMLLATRCLVGIGEGAYGPIASAMLADIFPLSKRGTVMALFNMAIPVGSALGFVVGGLVADATGHWRPAFYVTFSGLALGLVCFLMKEPPRPRPAKPEDQPGYFGVLRTLAGIRSFVLCCAGMTAVTFVIGGVAAWVPTYVFERRARFVAAADTFEKLLTPPAGATYQPVPAEVVDKLRPLADGAEREFPTLQKELADRLTKEEATLYAEAVYDAAKTPESPSLGGLNATFGAIVVLGGLAATATGAYLGEKLRTRVRGGYFWVIGLGALAALPCYVAFLYVPFPWAWGLVFLAVFGLFMHTGPAFTALANVTRSNIRATAFAINILAIHALGDAISPTVIGTVADLADLHTAFLLTSVMILLGGGLWLAGARYLDEDTRRATEADAGRPENPPQG
jgi:MFS family permease